MTGDAAGAACAESFLVLAGGESRRMGRDKAYLEVGGREMLDRLVAVGAGTTGRVVVAGREVEPLARAVARYGWSEEAEHRSTAAEHGARDGRAGRRGGGARPGGAGAERRFRRDGASLWIVADARPGRGPLAGLEAGLRAAPAGRCFAAACDVPLLTPELVRALLDELRELERASGGRRLAAVPRLEGRAQPLAAAYRTEVAEVARACLAEGERSVSDLLGRLEVRPVPRARLEEACGAPPGAARRWLLNVNRPGELERARTLCEARGDGARRRRDSARNAERRA